MPPESETRELESRRRATTPPPTIYFGHDTGTVTTSGDLVEVTIGVPVTRLHNVIFVDPSPLPKWFTLPIRQDGETEDEGGPPDWLPEALEELDMARADAEEEGYQQVTDLAAGNARKLLNDLARRVVRAPMVHSTPEGGIAIDFRNPDKEAAVLILCEPDGEGVCFHDIENERGRIRYSDTKNLLDAGGWFAISQAGLT